MHVTLTHGVAIPLAWVLAAFLAGIGIFALVAPKLLADLYGTPTGAHGFPFVRAAGLRDIVLAFLLAGAAHHRITPSLIAISIAAIVLALGDATIVWSANRRFTQPLLAHLAGALAFAVLLESVIWP